MRWAIRLLVFVSLGLGSVPGASAQDAAPAPFLKGRFLVADPAMPDPRFAGTVVYLIAHSPDGALGLVINRPRGRRSLADVMRAVGHAGSADQAAGEIELFWGGPVQPDHVVLLHSDEFAVATTVKIAPGVALTTPKDVLEAVAQGRGPARMLLAVGYAGWAPQQLEREIELKGWAVISAGAELLFDADHAAKWERAWRMRVQEL